MEQSEVLRVENCYRTYPTAAGELTVLSGVSFSVSPGESIALTGPSGSGKTTLLGICAGLDRATSGTVMLLGNNLSTLDEQKLARLRAEHAGFIFQNYHLIPTLSALENVMLPFELLGKSGARTRALELLEAVGLLGRSSHLPGELSGGEQQRVGIARAFMNKPTVLFADEPTGNLDEETGAGVIELMFHLNKVNNTTLLMATHNKELASRCSHELRLRGGMLEGRN